MTQVKFYIESIKNLYKKQSKIVRYIIIFYISLVSLSLLSILWNNITKVFESNDKIIKVENYVIKSKDENIKINELDKIINNWKLPNEEEINLIYKYRYEIPEIDINGNYLFRKDGYSTYFVKSFFRDNENVFTKGVKGIDYNIRLLKLYNENDKVDIVLNEKIDYKECITGSWYVTHSEMMYGYRISNEEILSIFKRGKEYFYDVEIITTDMMYGGSPKSEKYSGKMSNNIVGDRWDFETGNFGERGSYITIPNMICKDKSKEIFISFGYNRGRSEYWKRLNFN